jgi:hypothetical protein
MASYDEAMAELKRAGARNVSDFPGDRPGNQRRARADATLETNNNSETESIDGAPSPVPLQWLDMSAWDRKPIPERKWAIRDRVPLNQAGLFSGEGGTGKSIIELTKNIAHVTGRDWLGSMPEPGPAFYLGAEDDADEIHIRLAAIAKHYRLILT